MFRDHHGHIFFGQNWQKLQNSWGWICVNHTFKYFPKIIETRYLAYVLHTYVFLWIVTLSLCHFRVQGGVEFNLEQIITNLIRQSAHCGKGKCHIWLIAWRNYIRRANKSSSTNTQSRVALESRFAKFILLWKCAWIKLWTLNCILTQ